MTEAISGSDDTAGSPLRESGLCRGLKARNQVQAGSRLLKFAALFVAVISVAGNYLAISATNDRLAGMASAPLSIAGIPTKYLWGQFLGNIALPLGIAAILVAFALTIDIRIAQLDVDLDLDGGADKV
jgi:hypothetical protein